MVISKWKICIFSEICWPLVKLHFLCPEEMIHLIIWHFSLFKEMKHQSLLSQVCFRMGNETCSLEKQKPNILKPSQFIFFSQNSVVLPLAVLDLAEHFSGNHVCSWLDLNLWSIQHLLQIKFVLLLLPHCFLFFWGNMNTNMADRWANSSQSLPQTSSYLGEKEIWCQQKAQRSCFPSNSRGVWIALISGLNFLFAP